MHPVAAAAATLPQPGGSNSSVKSPVINGFEISPLHLAKALFYVLIGLGLIESITKLDSFEDEGRRELQG